MLDDEQVRAVVAVRLASLCRDRCGVSMAMFEQLVAVIDHDVLPRNAIIGLAYIVGRSVVEASDRLITHTDVGDDDRGADLAGASTTRCRRQRAARASAKAAN